MVTLLCEGNIYIGVDIWEWTNMFCSTSKSLKPKSYFFWILRCSGHIFPTLTFYLALQLFECACLLWTWWKWKCFWNKTGEKVREKKHISRHSSGSSSELSPQSSSKSQRYRSGMHLQWKAVTSLPNNECRVFSISHSASQRFSAAKWHVFWEKRHFFAVMHLQTKWKWCLCSPTGNTHHFGSRHNCFGR